MKTSGKLNILFFSVTPFDMESTSRYFSWINDDRYSVTNFFINGWPKNKICDSYYKINDYGNRKSGGIVEKCEFFDVSSEQKTTNKSFLNLKRFLRNAHGFTIIKKVIKEMTPLVHSNKPDIILLDLTYYSFLSELALYFAKDMNLPMCVSLNDDFLLIKSFRNGLSYFLLQHRCRKAFKNIESFNKTNFIFISEKMKDAYVQSLLKKDNDSIVIYPLVDSQNTIVPTTNQGVVYYGNIGLGRIDTLCMISKVLSKSFNLELHLYPNCCTNNDLKKIKSSKIVLHQKLPHDELVTELSKYDTVLLVESFKRKNISKIRYSISTKTGEALMMDKKILCIAPVDSGIGSLFKEYKIKYYCDRLEYNDIEKNISILLNSKKQRINDDIKELFIEKNNKDKFFSFISSKKE